MTDEEPKITDIFETLSEQGKLLLISSTHFSTISGGDKEALLATSALPEDQFEKATHELVDRGLMIRGNLIKQPTTTSEIHTTFQLEKNDNGDRYALLKSVKTDVLTKILHFPVAQVNANSPNF